MANSGASSLSLFSIGADGDLTTGSTLTTDTAPWSLGSLIRYQ